MRTKGPVFKNALAFCLVLAMSGSMLLSAAPEGEEPAAGESPPAVSETAGTAGADSFTQVAENAGLRLLMDPETFVFAVENKTSNRTWYSNPPAREEDPIAKAKMRQQMSSMLLVTYLNARGNTDVSASYTASVNKGGAVSTPIADGVRITYTFESEGFTIPVELALEEEGLACRILASEIRETGENRVMKVELLPYFGAGGPEDDGYLFVPDGSGALIHFNNGKSMYTQYSEKVFGRDVNFDLNRSFTKKEDIRLPVFGIQNNDEALLGIITKGAAAGGIKASVGGKGCSYNAVRAEFELLSTDTYILGETVGSRVTLINLYQEGGCTYDTLEVRYHFLSGENAGYDGMAVRYRRYLLEEGGLRKSAAVQPSLYLETLGAVRKKKSIFGIPVTVDQELTTYAEALEMLKTLEAQGVTSLALKYNGWDASSVEGKPASKLSVLSQLGGKKAFRSLQEYCGSRGIGFYPDEELLLLRQFGNGFSSFFNSAKTVSGNPAITYRYNIATCFKDEDRQTRLLEVSCLEKLTGKLTKSAGKLGLSGLSLGAAAQVLYSDFSDDSWNRQKSADALSAAAAALRESGLNVLAAGGNAYLLPYADALVDVPASGSRFDVEDESVPFMQIVLRGILPYAGTPFNLDGDPRGAFLQSVETGASLHAYLLEDSRLEELQNTDYTALFSAGFSDWSAQTAAWAKELEKALEPVRGECIRSHERVAEGLTITTYDNGVQILVNHTREAAEIAGVQVEEYSYAVVKEGIVLVQ